MAYSITNISAILSALRSPAAVMAAIVDLMQSTGSPVRVHDTYPAINVTTKKDQVIFTGPGDMPGFFIAAKGTADTLAFYDGPDVATGTLLTTITVADAFVGWNDFPVRCGLGCVVRSGGTTAGNYTFFGEASA